MECPYYIIITSLTLTLAHWLDLCLSSAMYAVLFLGQILKSAHTSTKLKVALKVKLSLLLNAAAIPILTSL